MGNENFNRTLDRKNSNLPLSVGEIDKDEFIEALKRLINKFGSHNFFYLPDTENTKMLYLIRECHSHTVS